MTVPIAIRAMREADGPRVLAIYGEGIATGHATFQDKVPDWADWESGHMTSPRLVAEDSSGLLGWAALCTVSGRCIYAGVAEVSVYLATAARGRGLGRRLLAALVSGSEEAGIWMLQAGIFPENAASIALHEAAGFRPVGTRQRLGRMTYGPLEGRWRDVVLLERRSTRVGLD